MIFRWLPVEDFDLDVDDVLALLCRSRVGGFVGKNSLDRKVRGFYNNLLLECDMDWRCDVCKKLTLNSLSPNLILVYKEL